MWLELSPSPQTEACQGCSRDSRQLRVSNCAVSSCSFSIAVCHGISLFRVRLEVVRLLLQTFCCHVSCGEGLCGAALFCHFWFRGHVAANQQSRAPGCFLRHRVCNKSVSSATTPPLRQAIFFARNSSRGTRDISMQRRGGFTATQHQLDPHPCVAQVRYAGFKES